MARQKSEPCNHLHKMKTCKVHVTNMLRVDTFKAERPICGVCGKPLELATDPIAKKITGFLWYCRCSPNSLLSVG